MYLPTLNPSGDGLVRARVRWMKSTIPSSTCFLESRRGSFGSALGRNVATSVVCLLLLHLKPTMHSPLRLRIYIRQQTLTVVCGSTSEKTYALCPTDLRRRLPTEARWKTALNCTTRYWYHVSALDLLRSPSIPSRTRKQPASPSGKHNDKLDSSMFVVADFPGTRLRRPPHVNAALIVASYQQTE